MEKTAFVFPGQGSQSVGMADGWLTTSDARALFDQASDILDMDLTQLVRSGPPETLNETRWTQPALLVTSVVAWRAWQSAGGQMPDYLAGHSLGEYSALVAAGALDFSDAVRLVHRRGQYMQQAVPRGAGAMAAVLGLDDESVESVCQAACQALDDPAAVSAANFNSPGQVVISGSSDGVARAGELARAAGAKRVMPLAVSVPSHCQLMRPAADQLAADLDSVVLRKPDIPVLHNVTARSAETAEEIQSLLTRQLYMPVHWTQIMQVLRNDGIQRVIECGPGKVLSGLVKRFDRTWSVMALHQPGDIENFLEGEQA